MDGKIFSWDARPHTGHPGEDYGCRCQAIPYTPKVDESFDISFSNVQNTGSKISNLALLSRYFRGSGVGIKLRDIGYLEEVVEEFKRQAVHDVSRLPGQIADRARKNIGGTFTDWFSANYEMQPVLFSLGMTTIGGQIRGSSELMNDSLIISGNIKFELTDEFADITSANQDAREEGRQVDENYGEFDQVGAKRYDIYDSWNGHFTAKVSPQKANSIVKRTNKR